MSKFEDTYNNIMDEIERKLREDSRMRDLNPRCAITRGSPTEMPRQYPIIYIAEGKVEHEYADSGTVFFTITFELEVFIKSRDREDGIKDIRTRCLRILDTLSETYDDQLILKDGQVLANGKGLTVKKCDFGYFVPDSNTIIYKGLVQVDVSVCVNIV